MKKYIVFLLAFFLLTQPVYAAAKGLGGGSNVVRIQGKDRYETAVKVSQDAYIKSEKVIIARGDDFPDALTGTSLAHFYNAPILLTRKEEIGKETLKEIERLGAKEVFLLGGTAAISPEVEESLRRDHRLIRLAGKNRVETSKLVLKYLKERFDLKGIGIASASKFPDALAAAPYLSREDYGLLLVDTYREEFENFFKDVLMKHSIAFGEEEAVSNAAMEFFKAKRIGGRNRYETAIRIAEAFDSSSDTIVVASGKEFPDALTAFSVAKKEQAPILLADTEEQMAEILKKLPKTKKVVFVGGKQAVSIKVEKKALDLIKDRNAPIAIPSNPPQKSPFVKIEDPALKKSSIKTSIRREPITKTLRIKK